MIGALQHRVFSPATVTGRNKPLSLQEPLGIDGADSNNAGNRSNAGWPFTRSTTVWLQAPFDPAVIDQINRMQAGVVPSPVHPLTCPNAKDGRHSFAGGYLGVLVAQREGLVCPTCGHTQGWLARTALACAQRDGAPSMGQPSQRMEKARQRALDDFARLVRAGHTHAQAMVDALQATPEGRGTRATPSAEQALANAAALPEPLAA